MMEANPNIQVLEIINGKNTFERTEEARDAWSVEMGDDSVFYSDEEQAHQSGEAVMSGFSGSKCRHLVNSVAEHEADHQKNDPGEEIITFKENSERKKNDVSTEEENRKFQMTKALNVFEPGEDDVLPESVFLPSNLTGLDVQTHYVLNESTTVSHQVRKEEMMEGVRSHPDPFKASQEESYSTRKEQLCEHLEFLELPQNPNQDHSSSSQPKKSESSAFNHLASSKYSTVSYRRIQRGNTRQKIEEFEFMLKNQ